MFKRKPYFVFFAIFLFMSSWSHANNHFVAVLETVSNFDEDNEIGHSERLYITDKLRENAIRILNNKDFIVMTRENINVMMNPDIPPEACEGECIVSTGRNIGANFVTQARIGRFGNKYTMTVEMYETSNASLISSFTAICQNSEELLDAIDEKAEGLYDPILTATGIKLDEPPDYSDEPETIPSEINTDSNRSSIHWIPIAISGAAIIGGTVLAIVKNGEAKDLSEKDDPKSEKEYKKRLDDIDSAQNMRAIGIGLAIVGGIGLTISIAF